MTQDTTFLPSLEIHKELLAIAAFARNEESDITLFEYTTKDELFMFACLLSQIHLGIGFFTTTIIAVPDCSILDLHELILESCYKNYDFKEMPKKLSALRRETWNMLKEASGMLGGDALIAIANAENLTAKAIGEIHDLNNREYVTFLLATKDNRSNVPVRESFLPSIHSFDLPQLLQINAAINAFTEQGMSATQAFHVIKDSQMQQNEDELEDNEAY